MYKFKDSLKLVELQCRRKTVMDKSGNVILEITFPELNKIRSRKIVSRSRARPTGKYPSWKMGRMMQWESHNELNAFRLLDANPNVTAFHEQPLKIHFQLDGERHLHYPDILVNIGQSLELWEIKPAAQAKETEYVERTKFLSENLPALGFSYRMITGDGLAAQPRLSNILTFLKFGRPQIPSSARELIRQILLSTNAIRWQSAINGDLGNHGRHILSRLFLEGELLCDLDKPLDWNTCFYPSKTIHTRG
jgi:hypothetical protein